MKQTEISFELGKCYEVLKHNNTKIKFSFWGGEPPFGKIIDTEEKVLISVLLDKMVSYKEINCPKV